MKITCIPQIQPDMKFQFSIFVVMVSISMLRKNFTQTEVQLVVKT